MVTSKLTTFANGVHTKGEYVGAEFAELVGETAIVMIAHGDDPSTCQNVYAQFDKFDLMPWSHHWHKLPRQDFILKHTRWPDDADAPMEVTL